MEIVVEIVNRAHKTIERHRYTGPVSIGRAFDNDLILSDTHVSPHHAVIREDAQGRWYVQDLDSKNGIYVSSHQKASSQLYVESGDEFVIGKVHLRVFALDHPVSETIGLSGWESFIYWMSQPYYFLLFFAVALLFFSGVEYSETYNKFTPSDFFIDASIIPIIALVWAGIWAAVGRILRHETRFMAQSIVALSYLIVVTILDYVLDIVAFNVPNHVLIVTLKNFTQGVLLVLLFSFNLRLATHKSPLNRVISSNAAAWSLVGLTLFVSEVNKPDFSPYPSYVPNVLPPAMLLSSSISQEDFLERTDRIFSLGEEDEGDEATN